MKTHAILLRVVLPAGIALIVVVCAIAQTHNPRMSIQERSIQIHPGTKITSEDQKALDAVLRKHNKSLYKIRTYDRGKVVKEQGTLENARIDQTLVAEANEAALRGVSFIALQIGSEHSAGTTGASPLPTNTPFDNSANKQLGPSPTPPPPPPNTNTVLSPMEVQELVSRVAPILQKYGQ